MPLRKYFTCLMVCCLVGQGISQTNQNTKVYPGAQFWSVFDGPPLGMGATIYNQNGVLVSYEIKQGSDPFGKDTRTCNSDPAEGQPYYYYRIEITIKNTNVDKVLHSTSAPSVSITFQEKDEKLYPGLCNNCACPNYFTGSGQITTMGPNSQITWADDSEGEWFFQDPEVTKWNFGSYYFTPSKAALKQSSAQRYNALIRAADSLYNAGQRQAAINSYRQALKEEGDEAYPKKRIREILDEIERLTEQHIQQAEQALAAKDYTTAISHLTQALNIDPSLNKIAKKIRKIKETIDALQAAAQQKKVDARKIVNDVEEDKWDNNGRHPWDELEEDPITFDSEPMDQNSHAVPDQKAFEQRSQQNAGDLVQSAGGNASYATGGNGANEPNYNNGLCYTLGRKLNRLFKKKYELEQQLNRAMESAAQGNTSAVNRMESITQRYERVSNAIIEINKERYQALKEKRLDPECHQDLIDLQSEYDEQSGANFERSFNKMSRKLEQQRRELGLD